MGATSCTVLLVIWEIVSRGAGSTLFPRPSQVALALWQMGAEGELFRDFAASTRRAALGYAGGTVAGITLGLLLGRSWSANAVLGAIVQTLRPIPVIAMVPFAIVWFGLGEASKYFLVAWGTFFPVWINTYLGVRNVDRQLIWAAASLGANRRQIFLRVILPASFGPITTGMRSAIGSSLLCLVGAEMAGAFSGLGFRVETAYLVYRVDRMMAALFVLGLLGAVSDAAVGYIIRRVAPWYRTSNE